MADIDPNFIANNLHQGRADAFNYGPGAEAERRQRIESNAQATDFNYGSGARTARSQNTIHQGLQNELLRMTNEQYQLNSAAYGDLNRNLTSINLQNNIALAEKDNRLLNSPVVMDALHGLGMAQITTRRLEAENEFARADAQTKIDQNTFTTQIAESSRVALQATTSKRVAQNQSDFTTNFQNAFQVDAQNGGGITAQTAFFDRLANSNLNVLQDAAPEALPRIGALLQDPHLTDPVQRQKLTTAYNTIGYIASQKNIGSSLSMLGNAENLAPGDINFKNHLASTGIDFKNPASANHFKIQASPTPDGSLSYTVTGPQGSARVSKQELDQSPAAQRMLADYTTLQASQKNPITARKQVQEGLAAIEKSDLNPGTVETYKSVVGVLGPDASPEVVSAIAPSMKSWQLDLERSNPLLSGELAEFTEGKSLPARIIYHGSGYSLWDSFTKPGLEQKLEKDPALADKLRKAIAHRSTGGMSPELYNGHIDRITQQVINSNPIYQVDASDPSRSPRIIRERQLQLRREIRNRMAVPQFEYRKNCGYDTKEHERGYCWKHYPGPYNLQTSTDRNSGACYICSGS
jgi:hypothetical protein